MSPFKKTLYHSAAYTVAISMLFLIFAKIIGIADAHLSLSKYFVILAFGFICAASEFLLTVERLPKAIRYLIHYLVLALAFFVIFMTVRSSDGTFRFNAAAIFASVAIFSIFYFLILAFVFVYNKKAKSTTKKVEKNKPSKEEYKPRFK